MRRRAIALVAALGIVAILAWAFLDGARQLDEAQDAYLYGDGWPVP